MNTDNLGNDAHSHAPPAFELTDIPFRGVARLVPFQGVGLGVRASGLDGNDGFNTLPRHPSARGVNVYRPGRRSGRTAARPSRRPPRPGLGAIVALAARHAQAQGTALPRQEGWILVLRPPRLRSRAGSILGKDNHWFTGCPINRNVTWPFVMFQSLDKILRYVRGRSAI